MIWKVIGQSVIGASHIQSGKQCEDAINFKVIESSTQDDILVGFISDGAGSAKFAGEASQLSVKIGVDLVQEFLKQNRILEERHLLELAETIYFKLQDQATINNVELSEFSCTLLGFIVFSGRACFLQIGDGAIVTNDGNGYFNFIWWPHNGEYQNTTTFLIDDPNFKDLKIKIVESSVTEIAVFTDGLQMLALNNETISVHQPFFTDLYKWLRFAHEQDHISILNNKLIDYLSSELINSKTDDDKTLLLATKVRHDSTTV
jgi:hypothetical protein